MLSLPFIAYILGFLVLKTINPVEDWRRGILRAGILIGVYGVLATEFLSLFETITTTSLTIVWILPCVLCLLMLTRNRERFLQLRFPAWSLEGERSSTILLFGIVLILFITGLVAWETPPQTWDSLNYHMSRVAHWTQMKAVQHYPTGIEVQNNMPPGAEYFVMHTYVLSQGDKWVNFVQWFAMLGSLVGVSWIARQLGVNRFGQLLAAVFAATIPMGIVQASSTMTDYVVSFWMVCVASETIAIWRGQRGWIEVTLVSLAAGLAILTKPTAYAFLLPFACLVLWSLVRNMKFKRVLGYGLIAILLVMLVIGGHFTRNQLLYNNPIGAPDRFDQHANQVLSLRGLLSNLIRNVSLHIRTPSPHVNKAFALSIQWMHDLIGLDENDLRTTAAGKFKISQPSTHEILTGNPLHALLIVLFIVVLIWKRGEFNKETITYTLVILATYILFSYLYKWLIFGSRLQLPFFVLSAPMVATYIRDDASKKIGSWVGVVLLLCSLPWLLSIETRPILPLKDRSPVDSVFTESRLNLLFSTGSYLIEPARDMVVRIEEAGCDHVGLMLTGNGVEYPFWYMLEAPRQDLRMEWIVEGTFSAALSDPDFTPCAVICENCQIQTEVFRNLQQVIERAPYRLYLGTTN
jgi:hypothetical protein